MAGMLALAICGVGYEHVSRVADSANARTEAAQQTAELKDKQNSVLQAQLTQQNNLLIATNQRFESQVLTLRQAITSRDRELSTQTVTVPSLTPTDLGAKWAALAVEPVPQIDSSGNFQVPVPLAQKSVVALMSVPVLQKDVTDLNNTIKLKDSVITNDSTILTNEKSAHRSDVETCKTDKLALSSEIKSVKSDARRGKIKSFVYGALATAVAIAIKLVAF
jgi:hypothetical protein